MVYTTMNKDLEKRRRNNIDKRNFYHNQSIESEEEKIKMIRYSDFINDVSLYDVVCCDFHVGGINKTRPAIIIQNKGYSRDLQKSTVLAVPLTTRFKHNKSMTRAIIYPTNENGLQKASLAKVDEMCQLKKSDIKYRIGYLAKK